MFQNRLKEQFENETKTLGTGEKDSSPVRHRGNRPLLPLPLFTARSELLVRPDEWCLRREFRSGADAATEADGGRPADRGRRVAKIYSTSECGADRPEQRSNMLGGTSRTQTHLRPAMCDVGICFEPLIISL